MARIEHGTLVAGQVTTVTLDDKNFSLIEVLNVDGSEAIYFTINGTTPTVEGDDCEVLPAAVGSLFLDAGSSAVVKLISSGTPRYSVKGW